MKVVVDIPNWLYNAMMEHREPHYSQSLGDAVRDGTPLPKGHGRLVDMSEVIVKLMQYYDREKTIGQCLDEVHTVIEADGGDTE